VNPNTAIVSGIGGGFGSGIILLWLWNGFMVPMGYPQMPGEVAVALAAFVVFLLSCVLWAAYRFITWLTPTTNNTQNTTQEAAATVVVEQPPTEVRLADATER
jgi:hypothetical protein